ncbi:Type IV secretion system protein VirB6 [Candidatus Phycorickettsia trachydisci]|uniref:Type IV secretion system protein VirB6 n=1 Tax=Candidatus Phycorickettsia trachydisci TaxID=2115978 RepID=A0A2P1P8D7_9RICK|nr:type IV secretion system protein [Candidatus Phycorickettsia trachydisci]AVP87538.1 Type IV secretion system protein VirB6 [Candidatus Phycorickettsia trachydisci]
MMRRFANIFLLITLLSHTISRAEITADSTYSALVGPAAADKGKSDKVSAAIVSVASSITTMVSDVMQMTCETQTFLNFVKGELINSCTPMPLMSFALKAFFTPNTLPAFLRLAMNQHDLLGYDNCSYYHRADYYNTKVEFGMCANYKLVPNMVIYGLGGGAYAAIKGMVKGDSFSQIQSAFQNAISLSPQKIYEPYSKSILPGAQKSEIFTLIDFPIPLVPIVPIMPLAIKKYDDKVCVIIDDGYMQSQIGCKYMKDPYQYSKYMPFKGESAVTVANVRATSDTNGTPYSALQTAAQQDLGCNNLNTCYYSAVQASKALLPISSPIINCVQSMLMNVVGASSVCTNTPLLNDPTTAIGSSTSAFYSLQMVLRRSVIALLTLYIILGGVKIALGRMTSSSEIIMFFLKAMLVSYFSIGLVYNGKTFSGMIDWVFPTFFGALNEMAGWVAGAGTSGLCAYYDSDYTGTSYALWDALDCRLATYIGINGAADLFTSLRDNGMVDSGSLTPNLGAVNYSVPPYMLLLLPALYTGNMYLFNLAIAWPIMVLSIGAYVIKVSIVCMIFIAIMGIMAPLFVPMALFEFTNEYFVKWRNTFLSFVLQPMISVTFMVILFSIYDYGFYGDCKYLPFYIKSPTGATLKSFYIDINSGSTGNCNKTLGWWLSEKFDFSGVPLTNGIPTVTLLDLNDIGYAAMIDNSLQALQGIGNIAINTGTSILGAVGSSFNYDSSGNFFNVAMAPMKEFFQLCMSMMTACFTLYIGYQLTEQLSQFAAELTGGMSVSGMVGSAKQSFDKMQQVADGAFKKFQNARNQAGSGAGGGPGGAGDNFKRGNIKDFAQNLMNKAKGGGDGSADAGDKKAGDTIKRKGAEGSETKLTSQSSSSKTEGSISMSSSASSSGTKGSAKMSNNITINSGNSTKGSDGGTTSGKT